MELPARWWCIDSHRHRHRAGPHTPDMTREKRGHPLTINGDHPGQNRRPLPGHQWGLFHGHGQPAADPHHVLPGYHRPRSDDNPHLRHLRADDAGTTRPTRCASGRPIQYRPRRRRTPHRPRCQSDRNTAADGPPATRHRSRVHYANTGPAQRRHNSDRGNPRPNPRRPEGTHHTEPLPMHAGRPRHEECQWTAATSQRRGSKLVIQASEKSNSAHTRTGCHQRVSAGPARTTTVIETSATN